MLLSQQQHVKIHKEYCQQKSSPKLCPEFLLGLDYVGIVIDRLTGHLIKLSFLTNTAWSKAPTLSHIVGPLRIPNPYFILLGMATALSPTIWNGSPHLKNNTLIRADIVYLLEAKEKARLLFVKSQVHWFTDSLSFGFCSRLSYSKIS